MGENSKRENREIPQASQLFFDWERSGNVTDGKPDMHAGGKSDEFVVPTTRANNQAADAWAESVEGRNSTQRNDEQDALPRTQSRNNCKSRGLLGVREAARRSSTLRFTALLHHINADCLTEAFYHLKRTAAVGVDGMTWSEYEQDVQVRIADLHERIHRGAYRASPSRRVWIPKADGRQRPLGIAALEDKIVQQAVLWVMQSIYEQDFLGFSYGFRPGRSQHDALDALSVAITSRRVNWIVDADIESFFDTMDHAWLIKFLEHRMADPRLLRLIRKWLCAGISEAGHWSQTTVGVPQGAVISPLLANIYLHYVFDLWIEWWRKHCQGQVIVVRYADDFVLGFEHQHEATACLEALGTRLAKFGLKLHEGKTRLIEFGRDALEQRSQRGEGRPATFNFLGFTHKCAKTRRDGRFTIHRHSMSQRLRRTLQAIRGQLRYRMHEPLGETGRWLRQVVQGWLNYHAVPSNSNRIHRFVGEVTRHWLHVLRRRSQRGRSRWTWPRMRQLASQYLPRPRILHPYPSTRFRARLEVGAV